LVFGNSHLEIPSAPVRESNTSAVEEDLPDVVDGLGLKLRRRTSRNLGAIENAAKTLIVLLEVAWLLSSLGEGRFSNRGANSLTPTDGMLMTGFFAGGWG